MLRSTRSSLPWVVLVFTPPPPSAARPVVTDGSQHSDADIPRQADAGAPKGAAEFTGLEGTWLTHGLQQDTGADSKSLEEIAYFYGTDKSKDDHKYVDLYMMLFDPIRWSVRNVTEVGIASGQSIMMWRDYFANASIYGIDDGLNKNLPGFFARQARIKVHVMNAYGPPARFAEDILNWTNESMDVIIDDALHDNYHMARMLRIFWRFVRPGGYYIIEDVGPTVEGEDLFNEDTVHPEVTKILKESTTIAADTLFGHRNFSLWKSTKMWGNTITKSRLYHNSHVLILRKRMPQHPPRPTMRRFFGDGLLGEGGGSMRRDWQFYKRANLHRWIYRDPDKAST